jgi:hypothetical protein
MTGANGEILEAQAPDPLEVRSRCLCPGGDVHDGESEIFTLKARLGFAELAVVNKASRWLKTERPNAKPYEVLATLSEAYVRHCIAAWTLTGPRSKEYPKGEPIAVTPENVDRFLMGPDSADIAQEIADLADDLYSGAVLGPLVRRASELREAGRTAGSTSPSRTNGTSRKQSSRSSTGSTRTGGTAATA